MQNAAADAAAKLKHFRSRPPSYLGLPLSSPSSARRRWLGMQLQSARHLGVRLQP